MKIWLLVYFTMFYQLLCLCNIGKKRRLYLVNGKDVVEVFMACFKALFQHLPGMTGKYGTHVVTVSASQL
jgi:hypothetical protein